MKRLEGCTQPQKGTTGIENTTFADFCFACADVSHLMGELDAQAVLISRGPLLPMSNIVRVQVNATTRPAGRPAAQLRRAGRTLKRRQRSK